MLELISEFQNETILAASIAVVGLIKDKGFLAKVDTRLISIVVTGLLILFVNYVVVPENVVTLL